MKNVRIKVLALLTFALVFAFAAPVFSAGEPILVGGNYEMSGSVAVYGLDCVRAATLAFEQVNAKGGILGGRPLKLVTYDNQSEASQAIVGATYLINQEKVVAMLGAATSSLSMSIGPVVKSKGIPMITPTGTNPKITQISDFIFRACFIDDFQGDVMAAYAYRNLRARRAAILIDQSSEYSKGLARYFKQRFTALKGTIVAEVGFLPEDRNFDAQLKQIRNAKADAIYAPVYYQPAGILVRQAREMNINLPILGGDGWDFPNELSLAASPKALNNIYYTNHYSTDSTSPQNKAFVQAYKARFGQSPSAIAALGYDAAMLLVDAFKRAGSTEPNEVREALAATTGYTGVTGTIRFDKDRNPIKSAVIMQLVNGVPQFKDEVEP